MENGLTARYPKMVILYKKIKKYSEYLLIFFIYYDIINRQLKSIALGRKAEEIAYEQCGEIQRCFEFR